jgi:hypothetical protein
MICCALCGYSAFGNTTPTFSIVQAPSSKAPYSIANAFMSQFCQNHEMKTWVICSYCSSLEDQTKNVRAPHLVMMRPSYLRSLLSEPCLPLQLLSLIDANMEVHQHFKGFASGNLVPFSLLESPLVAFGTDLSIHQASSNLRSILATNLRTNDFVQRFQTLLERPSPLHGLCVLAPTVLDSIIRENIQRGPLAPMEMNLMPQLFSLLTDSRPLEGVQAPRRNTIFEVGSLQLRDQLVRPRLTSFTLRVRPDGQRVTDDTDFQSLGALTLETALFPFLFPFASGAFNGAMTLCAYLQWRMHCFFSIFTLHKLYLFMMFQIRRAVILSTTFKHS